MARRLVRNPTELDDKRGFVTRMRSPKLWPDWPAIHLVRNERNGVVLDPPWAEFVDSKGKRLPQEQRPHEQEDWLRRAVFLDLTPDELGTKEQIVRALMTRELVDWPKLPHKVYADFGAMYATGWRIAPTSAWKVRSNPDVDDNPLDPERAKHTTMMATPDRWPRWPVLPLKNVRRGTFTAKGTGVLLDTKELAYKHTVFLINLYELGSLGDRDIDSIEQERYDSYGALYEAGWRVD